MKFGGYPAVSRQHISEKNAQENDTYFRLTLEGSGCCVKRDLDAAREKTWELIKGFGPFKYYNSGSKFKGSAKDLIISFFVFDPNNGKSDYSEISSRRFYKPGDKSKRIDVGIARNPVHEFHHVFSYTEDEYMSDRENAMGQKPQEIYDNAADINVIMSKQCKTLPWKHLLYGAKYNPGIENLVGAYGRERNGYHSEAKCMMNGRVSNKSEFGGSGWMRTESRFCNFCREITVYRLFERTEILDNPDSSWSTWKSNYRDYFYEKLPFDVPNDVPMRNSDGQQIIRNCSK